MDTFECGFCLSTVEAEDSPNRCPHCHVVRCQDCGTHLKGDEPEICYGCGAYPPIVVAHFQRTSNFSCVYMETDWLKRNRGAQATGWYGTSTSIDGKTRLIRWTGDGMFEGEAEEVRVLP